MSRPPSCGCGWRPTTRGSSPSPSPGASRERRISRHRRDRPRRTARPLPARGQLRARDARAPGRHRGDGVDPHRGGHLPRAGPAVDQPALRRRTLPSRRAPVPPRDARAVARPARPHHAVRTTRPPTTTSPSTRSSTPASPVSTPSPPIAGSSTRSTRPTSSRPSCCGRRWAGRSTRTTTSRVPRAPTASSAGSTRRPGATPLEPTYDELLGLLRRGASFDAAERADRTAPVLLGDHGDDDGSPLDDPLVRRRGATDRRFLATTADPAGRA